MSLVDLPVGDFLERVAARQPGPGGGAVAASTVAAAAALVAMAARFSDGEAFEDVVAAAEGARDHACRLADEDATAYGAVLEERRLPPDHPERAVRVSEAFARATAVPLAVVETAREIADLGARLVAEGNPNLRGDAVTAVLLAEAAGRSAAYLVELNVRYGGLEGDWLSRSGAACTALADAARAVAALR